MAMFDLRKQLKRHSNGLLQEFFKEREELQDVPWENLTKTKVEPIVAGIFGMPPAKRREVQVLLQSIANLSDDRGLRVIREELSERNAKLVGTWGALNRADKVLWVYLNARNVFKEAAVFARADAMSVTRYFNRWSKPPVEPFKVSTEGIDALEAGLQNYYSNESRGEHCEVHHYTRLNGNEYFFAYLPDWPNNFPLFNDEGELEWLDIPTVFTNLFVYEPQSGALEMIASGGNAAQQDLRRVFYQAMQGGEVPDADPDRPEFQLDHLLSSGFHFECDNEDRIETVTVPQILLVPLVDDDELDALQPRFRKGLSWEDSRAVIDSLLGSRDLSRPQVAVDHIQIRIQFMGDGDRRGKPLTIRTSPRSCSLKSVDDEELQVIAERCFRRWGIIND